MSLYDVNGNEINSPYDVFGNNASEVYDIDGNLISGITPLPLDYSTYTTTDLFTYVANGFDGFDVYDGIIAQLMANDKLYLFEVDGTVIATAIAVTSGHGNSASFVKDRYYPDDEFPLLYISPGTDPAKIYVTRITRSTSMLIKTIEMPTSKTGYYGVASYDEAHKILYMVGYSENSYSDDDGGNNKIIISKWDMSDLTLNQNGTYTPTFITRYFRDFIFVVQGAQFFDGYIWISSGHNNGGRQYVYAVNPADGTIEHTITLDDRVEVEGLSWIYDELENKYWMLIGQQNGASGINYSRIEFATAT